MTDTLEKLLAELYETRAERDELRERVGGKVVVK